MGDTAPETYDAFISEQVKAEEERKTSIEARAGSVISTSGAIVVLLFGLATLLTGQDKYKPPVGVSGELKTAVLFFALAVIASVLVSIPLPYRNVKPDEMKMAVEHLWGDKPEDATQRTAATRVKFLYRAQVLNQIKGFVLLFAITAEVVAVIAVALAVKDILLKGSYV